jgi:hypothetical protein
LLPWHQRPSHANLAWIQSLMRDRKWLEDPTAASSLHTGPFISTSSRAPTCDARGLKCLACLCAKATTRTSKIASKALLPVKTNVLKRSHLVPGVVYRSIITCLPSWGVCRILLEKNELDIHVVCSSSTMPVEKSSTFVNIQTMRMKPSEINTG